MNSSEALLVHSAGLEQYHYPPQCPFKTERAGEMVRTLRSMGLLGNGAVREPEAAPREVLEEFHTARYLDILQAAGEGHLDPEGLHAGLGTPDCPVFRGLYEYASLAAGATLLAADLVLEGEAPVAFNPSGGYHHAFPRKAAGFCYINDVVLGCLRLAEAGKRVLFLDVDVHHGDGVQNAFYHRADVMTLSVHESGETLFPGTGKVEEIGVGDGRGFSVNLPLPAGTYDGAYLRAFRAIVPPLVRAFDPDTIVLELGLDGLSGDPMAHLNLTNNAYAEVVETVLSWGKPIAATGGGGYHPENTARGWALLWQVFNGDGGGREDAMLGLGGVLMESTEWHGGLRDRALAPPQPEERAAVDRAIAAAVEAIQATVFPLHGLAPDAAIPADEGTS